MVHPSRPSKFSLLAWEWRLPLPVDRPISCGVEAWFVGFVAPLPRVSFPATALTKHCGVEWLSTRCTGAPQKISSFMPIRPFCQYMRTLISCIIDRGPSAELLSLRRTSSVSTSRGWLTTCPATSASRSASSSALVVVATLPRHRFHPIVLG